MGGVFSKGAAGGGTTMSDGVLGGVSGSSVLKKVLMLGFMGTSVIGEEIMMSVPLQPSGKKYLMFWLLCSSSLKSPTKEAFLKVENRIYIQKMKMFQTTFHRQISGRQ